MPKVMENSLVKFQFLLQIKITVYDRKLLSADII